MDALPRHVGAAIVGSRDYLRPSEAQNTFDWSRVYILVIYLQYR